MPVHELIRATDGAARPPVLVLTSVHTTAHWHESLALVHAVKIQLVLNEQKVCAESYHLLSSLTGKSNAVCMFGPRLQPPIKSPTVPRIIALSSTQAFSLRLVPQFRAKQACQAYNLLAFSPRFSQT